MPLTPSTTHRAACLDHTSLFQHPLVESIPTHNDGPATQRLAQLLAARAGAVCARCPLRQQCLYDAVVGHDVSGFAGGATAAERDQIRRRLSISVAAEDLDELAGVHRAGRAISTAEVLRLRAANPDESLSQLACRLGCSTSTVKRHLRQARQHPTADARSQPVRPTLSRVVAVAADVLGRRQGPRAA